MEELTLWEQVMQRPEFEQLEEEFEALNGDREAEIAFVRDIILRFDLETEVRQWSNKCHKTAEESRANAKLCFDRRQFPQAIYHYNELLCHAKPGSDLLCVGYMYRAFAFYSMKLYERAIASLDMALEANPDAERRERLRRRRIRCLMKIRQADPKPAPYEFKLCKPARGLMPGLAGCLKQRNTEQLGEHVVTKNMLYAGDVVAIEKPFAAFVTLQYCYSRCANCLLDKAESLFPCPGCTHTMFCSKACEAEARRNFHGIECPITEALFEMVTENAILALRILTEALACFGTLKKIKKYWSKSKESMRMENAFTKSKQRHYLAAITIPKEDLIGRSHFPLTFESACLFEMCKYHTVIGEQLADEADDHFLFTLLYYHMSSTPLNKHELTVKDDVFGADDGIAPYGYGLHLFRTSLCRHSCAPNTIYKSFGRTEIMFVIRNIRKGEEVLCHYGVHHYKMHKEARQGYIKFAMDFDCNCDACVHDYPLAAALVRCDDFLSCRQKLNLGSANFTYDLALSKVEEIKQYLRDYSRHSADVSRASRQVYDAQRYLNTCFHLFLNQ